MTVNQYFVSAEILCCTICTIYKYICIRKNVLSKNINSLINILANKVLHNRGFKSKHDVKYFP